MSRKNKQKKPGAIPASPVAKKPAASSSGIPKNLPLIILGCVLLFTAYCRMRLLDVPLERDEGEYAYVGQQLLHGVPPFVSIYHVKLPGIYAAYAIIEATFGQTHHGIHLGLLFVNALTAGVVFLIGRRLFNPLSGALAAAVFCLLSLSQKFLGFSANAEHFVVLPAMLGILFLLRAFSPPEILPAEKWKQFFSRPMVNFFLAGLLLGVSYTMKQHGLFFIAFASVFFFYKWLTPPLLMPAEEGKAWGYRVRWKELIPNGALFAAGVVLPLGILCLIFLKLGLFDKFWWWTWYYPRQYVAQISFDEGMNYFKFSAGPMWDTFWLLILFAGVGAVGLIRHAPNDRKVFVIGLFIFSFLALSAGFYYYPHYFVHATPAMGLLCAAGAEFVSGFFKDSRNSFLRNYLGAAVLGVLILTGIRKEKDYLFKYDGTMVDRSSYGGNPFPESLTIGKYIEQNTSPEDKIAVIGSEPQIYFYAKRTSATGFVYTYEMMKEHPHVHEFQTTMMNEIKTAKPKYILFVYVSASWFATPLKHMDSYIFDESMKYISENYEPSCIVDIGNRLNAAYCWEDPAKPGPECIPPAKPGQNPMEPVWMELYKRKEMVK